MMSNTVIFVAQIKVSMFSTGKCLTLNGVEIKSGEWMAVENCTMNCTCQKTKETEFMYCTPWCHIERTICREADIKSKVEYFEEVGKTGCKRCSAKVCDAISKYKAVQPFFIKAIVTRNYPNLMTQFEDVVVVISE